MPEHTALDVFEARVDIAAVDVLPWETGTPVSHHISAEGITNV